MSQSTSQTSSTSDVEKIPKELQNSWFNLNDIHAENEYAFRWILKIILNLLV